MASSSWFDSPERYGRISRGFHWLMAALFAWQFAGALLYVGIGDTALTRLVGGAHLSLGFVLFVLVVLRGSWGLINIGRRPSRSGRLGRAASVGHGLIYGLMILVPAMALLRQYGSGDAFVPFGIPVMPARGTKIEWMAMPANLFHYWLGFVLLAIIVGHVAFALVHRYAWKDDTLDRMT